jgi:hypothetical protein
MPGLPGMGGMPANSTPMPKTMPMPMQTEVYVEQVPSMVAGALGETECYWIKRKFAAPDGVRLVKVCEIIDVQTP